VKITFLGTSSGKTSSKRYHSSILFSLENYSLLVDAGDGVSRALLNNKIDFNSINGVLFTHLHPDHFAGFPALIVQMKMMERQAPLEIFIHESLEETVKELLIRSYLLPERIKFKIHYKTFKDNEAFKIKKELSILARKNSHLNELEKYQAGYPSISFYCASFLFEYAGKKIIYTSDLGAEDDLLLFREILADLYICELTHISLNSILKLVGSLKPIITFLTHYSDEEISSISEILTNLPSSQKGLFRLATDGLTFEF